MTLINQGGDMCLSSEALWGLVGSLSGGAATLLAVKFTYENDLKKTIMANKTLTRSLCSSIATELEVVWDRYVVTAGEPLMKSSDDSCFDGFYKITENYFIVYDSNAWKLGEIEDESLKKNIIEVYTWLKGQIDSFRMNNELLERFISSKNKTEGELAIPLQTQLKILNGYLVQMKNGHRELEKRIKKVILDLRAYANKSN